jgi:ABC-type nitrate/sulfonate/bicarbonate transport system substrate-binding protein
MGSTEKKEKNPRKNLKILETLLRTQNLNQEQKKETLEKIARLKKEISDDDSKNIEKE